MRKNTGMTEKFTISDCFGSRDRTYLSEVLRESELPEGVMVVRGRPIPGEVKKPFVVLTYSQTLDEGVDVYRSGALRYVIFNYDKVKLLQDLNGHI